MTGLRRELEEREPEEIPMTQPQRRIVSRPEWLEARRKLLAQEKAFTRQRDELSASRRQLPQVLVDKPYVFDGPNGEESLSHLFAGKSQLIVYHFMYGPEWDEGCPSCSFWADNFNGVPVHLAQRDISLVAVSRARFETIEVYRKRMGWTFRWLSSFRSDFNRDYHVSFTPEEMDRGEMFYNFSATNFPSDEGAGVSVFAKADDGQIFHTYSTYARGLDMLNGAYHYMDLVPKGRDESDLPHTMAWLRRHDQYE